MHGRSPYPRRPAISSYEPPAILSESSCPCHQGVRSNGGCNNPLPSSFVMIWGIKKHRPLNRCSSYSQTLSVSMCIFLIRLAHQPSAIHSHPFFQSSIAKPVTLENSLVLFVTTTQPKDLACAAIIVSLSPIRILCLSRSANISPK